MVRGNSLISLVLALEPQSEAFVPSHLGQGAHAIFLELVRQQDPGLAERLHREEGVKPFTVSSLLGMPPPRSSRCALQPGRRYFLRLTTFETSLSQLLLEKVLPSLPEKVFLEGAVLQLKEVFLSSQDHFLTGMTSHQKLAEDYLTGREPPSPRVMLEFSSPTTFRTQGKNLPLPLPGLVFGSLMERWNAFALVALHPDLRRYAEECLALASYDLNTRLVEVGGGRQVGFLGRASYIALNKDTYWLKQVNLLADFAFYAGVGAKTTMGLGQVRRISHARPLSGGTGCDPEKRG